MHGWLDHQLKFGGEALKIRRTVSTETPVSFSPPKWFHCATGERESPSFDAGEAAGSLSLHLPLWRQEERGTPVPRFLVG